MMWNNGRRILSELCNDVIGLVLVLIGEFFSAESSEVKST